MTFKVEQHRLRDGLGRRDPVHRLWQIERALATHNPSPASGSSVDINT